MSAGWSYERAAARVWTVRVGEPNKKLGACLRPPAYGLVLGRSLTTEAQEQKNKRGLRTSGDRGGNLFQRHRHRRMLKFSVSVMNLQKVRLEHQPRTAQDGQTDRQTDRQTG